MTGGADKDNSLPIVVSAALATVSVVFPGLAAGALAVQASDDFGVSEGRYGWALGTFFLAAAATSIPAGRLAQRLGPRRQLMIGLLAAAVTQLVIAGFARSFGWMLVALGVAGMLNSAVQTAVNLALSEANLPRLGLAVATKQSAMPASAMLGGLAVPVVALTLGWRWAYAMGGLVALAACALVARFIAASPRTSIATDRVIESTRQALLGAGLVSMLFAFSSGAINAWTVSSGVNAGLAEGTAGLMLSLSAGLGIVCRLIAGGRMDTSAAPPFRSAGRIFVIGILGFLALASRDPAVHALATILAFAGGWIWPVFTNFAIVNANPRSAGAATGVTQMGVYIGVFSAPVITGSIIDRAGYPTMWIVVAIVGAVGAALSLAVSRHFPRERSATAWR